MSCDTYFFAFCFKSLFLVIFFKHYQFSTKNSMTLGHLNRYNSKSFRDNLPAGMLRTSGYMCVRFSRLLVLMECQVMQRLQSGSSGHVCRAGYENEPAIFLVCIENIIRHYVSSHTGSLYRKSYSVSSIYLIQNSTVTDTAQHSKITQHNITIT